VTAGKPNRAPTLTNAVVKGKKVPGKSAICVFCGHVHPFLPAVPEEGIAPGNNNIIGPSIYDPGG
jgi:hypothetical protein